MQQTPKPLRIRYILIGIVLTLGIWLATVGLISFRPVPTGIDIASGASAFRDHCGSCHFLEKGVTMHHGPNFYDIGKVAGTRKPELTAAEYILESILNPKAFVAPQNWNGMPKSVAHRLSPDAIRNIVAYLAGRGARADYEEIRRLEIPDMRQEAPLHIVRRADMELAEQVLRDKGECLQCHSLYRNAEHQVFAPVLFGAGLVDEQLLRESIVDPNKVLVPTHVGVNVLLENGKLVSGKLISQTDDRIVLIARDEQNHPVQMEFSMSEIEHEDGKPMIARSKTSPMPTGLDKRLTPEELEAMVRLIGQLN